MRSSTESVTIAATPEEVVTFVADPENLPKWAIGFARSIRRENDSWIVTTPQGDVTVQICTDSDQSIVDFVMSPAPGVTVTAYSRVLPNEEGAEYVFTQFQTAGMADEIFEGQIEALGHEFNVLKSLLEVQCPTG